MPLNIHLQKQILSNLMWFFDRIASWFGKSSRAGVVEFCMAFAFLQKRVTFCLLHINPLQINEWFQKNIEKLIYGASWMD